MLYGLLTVTCKILVNHSFGLTFFFFLAKKLSTSHRINLPAALKMTKPRYQDIQADAIPTVEKDGVRVRVLSGEFDGTRGPVTTRHPVMIYDVRVPANCTFRHSYPAEYNSFAWVSEGAGKVNGNDVERQHAVIFEKDTGANVEITARTDMHFLLFAGKPIGEPIVQHG